MAATPDGSESYRLDPGGYAATAKRRIYKRLAWLLPLTAAIFGLELTWLSRSLSDGAFDTLPLTIAIVVVALGFGLFRGLRLGFVRGRAAWDSYRLTIDERSLRRVTANQPTVEILRGRVTKLVEQPEGLSVASGELLIFVPKQLIAFSEVREELSTWHAFEARKLTLGAWLKVDWSGQSLGKHVLRFVLLWALLLSAFFAIRFLMPR